MKKFLAIMFAVLMSVTTATLMVQAESGGDNMAGSGLVIENLKTDNLINPLGIDSEKPVFSWNLKDPSTRGQKQTSYRIMVAESEAGLKSGTLVWDSGKVESDETAYIEYNGSEIAPRTRYFWQVEVWDKDGTVVESDVAWFETGLMDTGWSGAKWIARSDIQGDAYYDLTSFKIELRYVLNSHAMSLLFGATSTSDFYMWQTSSFDWHGDYRFRPQKCVNGGFSDLPNHTSFESTKDNVGTVMTMTVEAENDTVKTYHNGVLKDTRTISGLVLGYVGFRQSGTESFSVDSIKISDGDGNIVFEEGFENSNANFDGATVSGGMLNFNTSTSKSIVLRTSSGTAVVESAPMFRRDFTVSENKTVEKARLYITSAGIYRAFINGVNVTDTYLNPGMTAYGRHIMYQTYDVTDLINSGDNAIGAYLGHGWWNRALRNFGPTLFLYGKLVVDYTDGTSDIVVTDDSWRFYRFGPIIDDDIFNGFKFDGTVEAELEGWNKPGYDDGEWDDVTVTTVDKIVNNGRVPEIIAQNIPYIRDTITLEPVKMTEPKEGVYVYDFGQNIAGVVRIKATAPKGTKITLRHAESLNAENMRGADDEPGTIFRANLPRAEATDTYIFKGDPEGEVFEPFFTYHGFRYLEITGIDEPLPFEDVKALLIMSDLPQTSTFESSHALVNRLYLNSLWSARDNFLSVPTDCPQRGERFGWTGDAQIFTRTGSYMMDVNAFYQKYCMDIRDTSTNNRIIADVAPASSGNGWYGSGNRNEATNGFGDAIAIIPYQIYKQYGNKAILEENYVTMCNWMDYLISTSTNYIRDESWTGDWMCVNEKKSPVAVTDTAYCAYTAFLISEIAEILGKTEDVVKYTEIYNNYRNAWRENFLEEDGCTTKCGTQTSYVLGLKFGLFDEDERAGATQNLVNNIEGWDWHLTTGFLGYSFLNPILSDYGRTDVAYKLLEQTEYPSSLYSVTMGATTIWESWYVMRRYADGSTSVNEESQNHFSYGSVSEWLFRYMLGIERDDENSVAFKHFLLKPEFGGTFTYAKGSYDSIKGTIESGWALDKETGTFTYKAVVPANTTATLYLPVKNETTDVIESGVDAAISDGISYTGYADGCKIYELASGTYEFTTMVESDKNEITTVNVTNPLDIKASVVVNGTALSEFPGKIDVMNGTATIYAESLEEGYKFSHFIDKNGEKIENGSIVNGTVDYKLMFVYTGIDDGKDGKKTITITGEEGVELTVNGNSYKLPWTCEVDKGEEVTVTVTKVPVGDELIDVGGIKHYKNTIIVAPECDMTLNANTEVALNRVGFDVFFDFENGIEGWSAASVTLSSERGYMVFDPDQKADGSYDPRAYYDFTASSAGITEGEYLQADKYEKLIIGYIADEVASDSTPYLYISTEAQPSYTNPVRGKKATSAITTDMADGKTLRTVEFELAGWTHWTGNIKQIYLDVLDNVDGKLRIKYIKFQCRDLKLNIKNSVAAIGDTFSFIPGSTVDLTQFETEEGFLGYSLVYGSEDYITEVVLNDDTVVYANYENSTYKPKVWSFDDGLEGWTMGNVGTYSVSDGTLKADCSTTTSDLQMSMTVNVNASEYGYVVVDMKHSLPGTTGNKPLEVFFRLKNGSWTQSCSANTELFEASSDFKRYVIDLTANSKYAGEVANIRIDPVDYMAASSGAGSIEIDQIMFLPIATVVLEPGYTGGETVNFGLPACIPVNLSDCPVPKREGFNFLGWTDGITDEVITEDIVLTESRAFYAKWERALLVWDFDDGTNQGWSVQNGVDKGINNGIYKVAFSKTNADTWIKHTSLNFDATQYKYVIVYMRHNVPEEKFGSKSFQAFFVRTVDVPWQSHLSTSISQKPASDLFVPYVVDMTKCIYWNGNVTHLRIDPFEITSEETNEYYFEVDKVLVSYDVKLNLDGTEYTVPAGVTINLSDYSVPTKTGYRFKGWAVSGSDEVITSITPENDVTLVPTWIEAFPEWNFDDNTTQGWTTSVSGTISAQNGALKVLVHNTNPDVYAYISDLNIDASVYKYGVVYMRHNVPADACGTNSKYQMLFYNTNSSWWAQMLVDAERQPAGTEFNRYIFNLGANAYWSGTIKRLRLDAFDVTASSLGSYYSEVDKIILCPEINLSLDYACEDIQNKTISIPGGIDIALSDYGIPEREGYRFLGWKGIDGRYVTVVNSLKDVELTAVWKATAPAIVLTESYVKIENLEKDAVLVLSGYDIDGRLVDTVSREVIGDIKLNLKASGLDIFESKTVKAFLFDNLETLSPLCKEKSTVLYMLDYQELEGEDVGFMGRWFDFEHADGNTYMASFTPGSEMYFKVSGTTKVYMKLNNEALWWNPYIAVSVDGGKPERIQISKLYEKVIASELSADDEHIIRVTVDSFACHQTDKWINGNGLVLEYVKTEAGGNIVGLMPKNPVIAFYGDSITEGLDCLSSGQRPEDSSAISAYPYTTANLLGFTPYLNGYGSSGITVSGSGSVPKCLTVIDYVKADTPIVMPELDAIVVNHGHNDLNFNVAGDVFEEEYLKVLVRLREKHPDTPIFAVVPYAQRYVEEIRSAVETMDDENIHYISTAGWEYTTTDGVHPDADGAQKLGIKLAAAISEILKD